MPGNKILIVNSLDLYKENCLGCGIRKTLVEKAIDNCLLPTVPLSFLRWQPAPPCYQHHLWEPVRRPASHASKELSEPCYYCSSLLDCTPPRLRSRLSSFPVDMKLILQKHAGLDFQRHLSNNPSTFSTVCFFAALCEMLSTSEMAHS